jgi:hypothetical protein
LEGRILLVLEKGPLAKSDIARSLGKGRPSGHLHETIAGLVASGVLAYTHPDKPHSRLQRYQLTAKGRERLPTRP